MSAFLLALSRKCVYNMAYILYKKGGGSLAAQKVQQRTAGGIAYTLTRRRVRNINLRVRADGSVAASASVRVPVSYVDAFVAARADWVRSAQARAAVRREREEAERPELPAKADALAHMQALCRGILSAVRGQLPGRAYAQNRRAGHDHPLGVVQPAHRHAGLCAAALCDAAGGAGICGRT